MKVVTRALPLVLAALMLPGAAYASSDAEWAKFAKDVEQKCTDATAETFKKSQVVVDPTGSTNFGLAIVYGRSKAAKAPAAIICVYDKKTMAVEVGGELGPDLVRIRKPKPDGQSSDNGKPDAGAKPAADSAADDGDDAQ